MQSIFVSIYISLLTSNLSENYKYFHVKRALFPDCLNIYVNCQKRIYKRIPEFNVWQRSALKSCKQRGLFDKSVSSKVFILLHQDNFIHSETTSTLLVNGKSIYTTNAKVTWTSEAKNRAPF